MDTDFQLLAIAAVTIAFLHTLTGPDHYLPFIALAKARSWSLARTLFWVAICGCGHVLSSVLLAMIGAAIGWSLSKITWLESLRGGIAGWALLLFGLLYAGWGLLRSRQNVRHKHFDGYDDGAMYVYEHRHGETVGPKDRHPVTPWVMFLIFVLGPCEPMIPLLSNPVAVNSAWKLLLLVMIYTFFTLITMLLMVSAGYYGLSFLNTDKLQPYTHALGGLAIFICGAGMVFLEW